MRTLCIIKRAKVKYENPKKYECFNCKIPRGIRMYNELITIRTNINSDIFFIYLLTMDKWVVI